MPITSQTLFVIGDGFDGPVHAAVFRADGYLYVSGAFSNYKATSAPGLCRIKPNGDLDTSFSCDGFTASADYYPPSQLLPTLDGGVICVLAKTHVKLINGTAVFDRMEFDGSEVAPIVKLSKTGELDTDFQCGVSVGTTIASATLVGVDRIAYIVQANPTLVKVIDLDDLWEWRISCAMAGAFNDILAFNDKIALVGPTLTAQVARVEPVAETFTTGKWPLGLKVMLTDFTLEPDSSWVTAAGTGGSTTGWTILWDEVGGRLYIGQPLVLTSSFGQWNSGTSMANRGMYQLSDAGTSEWSLRVSGTAEENGFEPYQNTVDDDGYPIVALPFAVRADGVVFCVAPFGAFRNTVKDRHTVIAVNPDGTLNGDFTLPAMVDAGGDPRVTCATLSPNGSALFVAGRFTELGADTVGYAALVNAETGVRSDSLAVVAEDRLIAYTGNGVRSFVFTGFSEGVYGLRGDK